MENQILNTILSRLDNIDNSLKAVQATVNENSNDIKNLQSAVQKNSDDIKIMNKNIVGLRDDVDTIYDLQKSSHSLLLEHDKLLKVHSNYLEQLLKLAGENKKEYVEFDTKLSRLEALIS